MPVVVNIVSNMPTSLHMSMVVPKSVHMSEVLPIFLAIAVSLPRTAGQLEDRLKMSNLARVAHAAHKWFGTWSHMPPPVLDVLLEITGHIIWRLGTRRLSNHCTRSEISSKLVGFGLCFARIVTTATYFASYQPIPCDEAVMRVGKYGLTYAVLPRK